jgi:GAF domain-containing protein
MTIVQQVLRDGVALLSSDGASESTTATQSLISTRAHSVMCVPFILFERKIGVLYLDTTLPRDRFNREHLQLVTAIAGIAAVAIENARQFEWLETENQRRAQHGRREPSDAARLSFHFQSGPDGCDGPDLG